MLHIIGLSWCFNEFLCMLLHYHIILQYIYAITGRTQPMENSMELGNWRMPIVLSRRRDACTSIMLVCEHTHGYRYGTWWLFGGPRSTVVEMCVATIRTLSTYSSACTRWTYTCTTCSGIAILQYACIMHVSIFATCVHTPVALLPTTIATLQ